MEKAGFALTVVAGFATCALLTWQGFAGARADWVSGFLCVLWSLLMLARLTVLTAPAAGDSGQSHLAYRLIQSLNKGEEKRRRQILQQSFGTSYAVFLLLGVVLVGWQVFCAVFSANHYAIAGFTQAAQTFFSSYDTTPSINETIAFDWGQGFFYLLILSMMGFLLRSYSFLKQEGRAILLILASYVSAGWITFFGFTLEGINPEIPAGMIGYGPATQLLHQSSTLFDRLVLESGILGIAFMACILFVPLAFIWLSLHEKDRRDWVTIACGSLAAFSLFLSVFLSLHPALDGFIFLCWMAVFLAWGRSETRMFATPA